MKKVLFRTMMVAVCTMMMAIVMTGCNGNQNDPQNPQDPQGGEQPTKIDTVSVAALMEFEFQGAAQMLETFDITIEYYDENSQLKSEAFTGEKIAKKIITKTLPATTGVRFTIAKKADLDEAATTFHSDFSFAFVTYAVNAAGERSGTSRYSGGESSGEQTEFDINLLDKYLAEMARNKSYVYEFDSDGEGARKVWE